MTHHKFFKLGGLELHVSHNPEDRSVSAGIYRKGDTVVRASAYGPALRLGAGLELAGNGAGEEPIRLHLHALLGSVYLTIGGAMAERIAAAVAGARELAAGLEVAAVETGDGQDVMVSGSFLADRWSGKRSDPRFAFSIKDKVLGDFDVTNRLLDEQLREVTFPEGVYQIRFSRFERITKRRRWPWSKSSISIEAQVLSGPGARTMVPVPGKGESAHDCDDSGWYSLGLAAATIDEAELELISRVMRYRNRHGGAGWRPAVIEPAPTPGEPTPPPAAAA